MIPRATKAITQESIERYVRDLCEGLVPSEADEVNAYLEIRESVS